MSKTKPKAKRPATAKKAPAKPRARKVAPAPASIPASGKVLVLRTCDAQGRSYGNFVWPESGPVAAPDWLPCWDPRVLPSSQARQSSSATGIQTSCIGKTATFTI